MAKPVFYYILYFPSAVFPSCVTLENGIKAERNPTTRTTLIQVSTCREEELERGGRMREEQKAGTFYFRWPRHSLGFGGKVCELQAGVCVNVLPHLHPIG